MNISRNADKFVLRLPDGMREQIAVIAKDGQRSMNSEIVYRLQQSFITRERVAHQSQLIEQLSNRIRELEEKLCVAG